MVVCTLHLIPNTAEVTVEALAYQSNRMLFSP